MSIRRLEKGFLPEIDNWTLDNKTTRPMTKLDKYNDRLLEN